MATVTSLTASRIQELLAGWESVGLSQDEINSLVIQLKNSVLSMDASLTEFNEVIRPRMEADFEAGSIAVSNLNDNLLPALQSQVDEATLDVMNLVTVDVPSLRADMDATQANVAERPNVYVQDEPPENPDENGRELVVGDSWFDSNDNHRQRIWNGVEWSTFNVDVADFSLTVKSFKTTRHQIY